MPLISNVGHHGKFEMFSLRLSLRSKLKCEPVCAASKHGLPRANAFAGNASLLAWHRSFALRNAPPGQAGALRLASAVHRSLATSRSSGFCMSVVGAPRRSAAPGSQSVGAAGYGSSVLPLGEAGAVGSKRPRPYRLAPSVACHRAMPNPSIERTCPGKPGHASHVKRWASR